MTPPGQDITGLLVAWSSGDQRAFDGLVPVVYDELRRIARRYMEQESSGHLLQTTALAELDRADKLMPGARPIRALRGHAYAVTGRRPQALKILQQLTGPMNPSFRAFVSCAFDELAKLQLRQWRG